jgi:hypothetical protein
VVEASDYLYRIPPDAAIPVVKHAVKLGDQQIEGPRLVPVPLRPLHGLPADAALSILKRLQEQNGCPLLVHVLERLYRVLPDPAVAVVKHAGKVRDQPPDAWRLVPAFERPLHSPPANFTLSILKRAPEQLGCRLIAHARKHLESALPNPAIGRVKHRGELGDQWLDGLLSIQARERPDEPASTLIFTLIFRRRPPERPQEYGYRPLVADVLQRLDGNRRAPDRTRQPA